MATSRKYTKAEKIKYFKAKIKKLESSPKKKKSLGSVGRVQRLRAVKYFKGVRLGNSLSRKQQQKFTGNSSVYDPYNDPYAY